MSLNLPLAARFVTAGIDRHITRDLHDMSFRSTAPGGYASATFALSRGLNLQPEEIADFAQVFVYDRRNGRTLWEGRLEDSGRSVGDSGAVWQVAATGPAAYAQDRTISVIYVDQRMDSWAVGGQSVSSINVVFDDTDGITMSLSNTTQWNAGTAGLAVYHGFEYTGQQVASATIPYSTGFASSNMEARLSTSLGTGVSVTVDSQALGAPPGILSGERGGPNPITAGHDTVRLRFVRNVSNFPASTQDDIWISYSAPRVRGLLKDTSGNDITFGYVADTVYATEVVQDLLGRLLNRYDGPNASIEQTFFTIDQLAYPDGANAQKVLEDLMLLEPAYYWAAWESGANGLHRFEWRSWPTEVRYEASAVDGFDSPASAAELYNAVSVRWRNSAGVGQTTRRTSSVPALTAAGLTREAYIDLSDEVGSATIAVQTGDAFLAEHRVPVNQGTLTVSRPITDFETGAQVMPWEILPGHLIRVRDVLPRLDSLNLSGGRDGVSVFKIAAVEFNAGRGSASLELDSYPMTVSRAVAELSKRRIVRKR